MVVFSAKVNGPMRIGEVLEKICDPFYFENGTPRLIAPEWEDSDQLFADGERFSFSMPFESTRGIKVWREGDLFNVRLLPLSSNAEFEMGMRFLEVCTEYGAIMVESNADNSTFALADLRSKYTVEFNEALSRSALRTLMFSFERGEMNTTVLPCPSAKFIFGPGVATFLSRQPDERIRVQTLLEMMKRLQYALMTKKYANCSAPVIRKVFSKRIAVVKPDVFYVINEVDALQFDCNSLSSETDWRAFLLENVNRLTEDKLVLFDESSIALRLNAHDIKLLIKPPASIRSGVFLGVEP